MITVHTRIKGLRGEGNDQGWFEGEDEIETVQGRGTRFTGKEKVDSGKVIDRMRKKKGLRVESEIKRMGDGKKL